ncbi:MAG: hypothetical protein JXA21_10895 [Anaerolineae bacterium]|nr:hypothetical protein [Anaerolineae bacterium]
MATVWIPVLPRDLTGGQVQVEVPGQTVQQVVVALDARYPGIRDHLCEGAALLPTLAVRVDGRVGRLRLREPVGPHSFVAQGHFELAGMRERAAMINAKFVVQTAVEYGTVVVLELVP